jgi:hypothetical protein
MTDRTGKEQAMKRTALILGIAAALAVPATASAGSKPENKAEVAKPEISKVQVAQVYRHKAQVAQIHRVKVALVSVERATAYRLSLQRIR